MHAVHAVGTFDDWLLSSVVNVIVERVTEIPCSGDRYL